MSAFDPMHLSPLAGDNRPLELPYGLTWAQVGTVLADFDPLRSAEARAFASHEKQGLNGGENSIILTLVYPARAGGLRRETLFFKAQAEDRGAEAEKYRFLVARGIPTPRLLATFHVAGREVLLLEFLEEVGLDCGAAAEVEGLLDLLAGLNAVEQAPAIFEPGPGMDQAAFDAGVRAALEGLVARGLLAPDEPARWYAAYQAARAAAGGMRRALNHGEMAYQQVGWARRAGIRELVLFDLQSMSLAPRFVDLTSILSPLARESGRAQEELLRFYLARLEHYTGRAEDFTAAWCELRVLRVREACYTLPWLAGIEEAWAVEALRLLVECLREDVEGTKLDDREVDTAG